MITLKLETTIALEFWKENKLRLRTSIPELKDSVRQILTMESFEKLIHLGLHCDSIYAEPVIEFQSPEECLEQIDFFILSSTMQLEMPSSAVEANWASLDSAPLQDKGGWAPISIPERLVYSTRLQAPREIGWLQAGHEFAVSEEFLRNLSQVDPGIYGLRLYANAFKTRVADGVWQLAVDQFAMPCVVTNSVIPREKGFGRRNIPGSNLKDSGIPVLPRAMLESPWHIMRSAEPWDDNLGPGWIVTKDAAIRIAGLSDLVELCPIFTEGSECHKVQEALFKEANEIISKVPGARWSLNSIVPDFGSVLRKRNRSG